MSDLVEVHVIGCRWGEVDVAVMRIPLGQVMVQHQPEERREQNI
jgi:hypothetical protein